MKQIGMIGIGLMGHGIASNLQKHGHALTLLDHPGNQPLDALKAGGAKTANTPMAVAQQSEIIILCVTGSPQVEAVLTGEAGVLKGLKSGAIVIDCSTAVPASTVKLAQQVVDAGGRFMDAAMTRTPKEAAAGKLNLLVGSDADLLATCHPILSCFAENIVHAGPIGAGHQMKLLHNYVSLGSVALLSEAAACAQRAGVNAQTFVDVLSLGGGWGAALDRINRRYGRGDGEHLGGYHRRGSDETKERVDCGGEHANQREPVWPGRWHLQRVRGGRGREPVGGLWDHVRGGQHGADGDVGDAHERDGCTEQHLECG